MFFKVALTMKVPDKIYLQTCGDCPKEDCENCKFEDLADVSWCTERIFKSDRIYISKESLLEWAKKKKAEYDAKNDDAAKWGQVNAFQQLIDKLNR